MSVDHETKRLARLAVGAIRSANDQVKALHEELGLPFVDVPRECERCRGLGHYGRWSPDPQFNEVDECEDCGGTGRFPPFEEPSEFRCAHCGQMVDTPMHELGCREEAERKSLDHDPPKPECGFCKGRPVRNAATWLDGKPRDPLPCPRCGETHFDEPTPEHEGRQDG